MALSLYKGQKISLAKVVPGLTEVFIGLGWDVNISDDGYDFDLDASAFLLGGNGKLVSDYHFVFYNNLVSPDLHKSVEHAGDNLTGSGDGDDEVIKVNLKLVPTEVEKIVITVTIHEALERQQNFGQVENSFVRVVNALDNREVVRYNLSEDFSTETAITMAELYREKGEWKIQAIGVGSQGGLQGLLNRYQG